MNIIKLKEIAKQIRRDIVTMTGTARVAHSGSALSAVDALTALYFNFMKLNPKKPNWPGRDRFILSKGHAATALYAALANRGFFKKEKLKTFAQNGSHLTCHPSIQNVPGVEATTGALGHGLSIGVGMALAGKRDNNKHNIYVMISDGECDEGSVWEAVLFAGHHKLNNLTIIVDYNKIQSFGRTAEVLDLEPLTEKFKAFNWWTKEVDGHNLGELLSVLKEAKKIKNQPQCLIAHTVKGKGVSFMEDRLEWHYWSPSGDLLKKALEELA
ncbi:MAG: transketolase [Candidatus Harrisonbacteria bacterium]|nr:transketolase [Candidatus Harrisonbacteria bacterium]